MCRAQLADLPAEIGKTAAQARGVFASDEPAPGFDKAIEVESLLGEVADVAGEVRSLAGFWKVHGFGGHGMQVVEWEGQVRALGRADGLGWGV